MASDPADDPINGSDPGTVNAIPTISHGDMEAAVDGIPGWVGIDTLTMMPARGSHHSIATRASAALNYLMCGDMAKTSKLCGVHERTIYDWAKTEWWSGLLSDARNLSNARIESSYTRIIDKSLSRLEERLDSAEGSELVSAKDLAMVSAIAYDKRALMRGDPTSRVERVSKHKQALQALTVPYTVVPNEGINPVDPQSNEE